MYCTNCGRKIENGERYCPYCGTKTFDEHEFNQQNANFNIPRRSIPVCIILSIITFGIYGIYWLYCLANDVNTLTGEEESSGFKVLALSIITLGLYELYWLYKVGVRLSNFQAYQGEMVDSYRALVYLLLGIFGLNIVARALIQNDLNKYATAL